MSEKFDDDRKAYKYLVGQSFIISNGMISHPEKDWQSCTESEKAAISYLCSEWDHSFEEGQYG